MAFRGAASYFVIGFNLLVLFYFTALNTIYIVLFTAAFFEARKYVRRRKIVDLYEVFRSPLTPSISILVPAFNEEATIAESVKSVLMLHYPRLEVVVINDGSLDRTLEVLVERYKLRRITKVVPSKVACRRIRGVYISTEYENLVVVDKENGGKADALNAGINVCRHDLMSVIDADSLIEPDGLLKVARPFIEDPEKTVATGGLVRIVNGCKVVAGSVTEVRLPRDYWADMQIMEYLRAFLGGRMGWSALRSLLIISGAFGLFTRQTVIDIGGYRADTVGEDMDLVVRLHRHLRENKRKYRMYFVPDPVCWTEAPDRYTQLARQRDRWQRGLIESLTSNVRMLLNPRYGTIGLFAMPYFFFFEMLGPAVELLGYIAVVLAIIFGFIDYQFFVLFIAVAFLYSMVVSLFAVYLEGFAFQRYPRIRSLLWLALFAIIENVGYRQINAWWRTKAYFTYFTRKRTWGAMERTGYGEAVPAGAVSAESLAEAPLKAEPWRRGRFAWLLLVPIIVLSVVLGLILTRDRERGNYLALTPTFVETGGAEMVARAQGKYFQVHTADGWQKFVVKGVNVGIALPGKWFSEFPASEKLYNDWFEKIAAMNANTIRVYTLLDPIFYRTLARFNSSSGRKLMLLQEIWPPDEVPGDNLYDPAYNKDYRAELATDIEALLGRANIPERKGRAWGTYDADVSSYLLGLLIGREITWEEASATNALNPGQSGYNGAYVSAPQGANAVETWLAQTCDHAAEELVKRRWLAPVSFVSWPTLDPMTHPTESTPGQPKDQEQEDTQVVDPNHIKTGEGWPAGLFGCYHIYPYYPDFMNREPAYAEYRDDTGVLRYGGYLKQFIELHPSYPALVGEFGMSTSLGVAHLHPEGFNHGGVTERQQGEQVSRMYRALLHEGYAGGAIFEWADEWAKRTWVDMDYMIPYDRHIYWHNLMDPEQNYGVLAYDPDHEPFSGSQLAYYRGGKASASGSSGLIDGISVDHDEAFLYLKLDLAGKACNELKPGGTGDLELLVGIDTFGKDNGTRKLPVDGLPILPTGVEFLLRVSSMDGGLLLARPDYDRGDTRFMADPSEDPTFVPIELPVNRAQVSTADGKLFPVENTNDSKLTFGDFRPGSKGYDSLANWYVSDDGKSLQVRLPWLLLNVSDPSSRTVLHDDRTDLPVGPAAVRAFLGTDALGTEKTEGFFFYTATTRGAKLVDFKPGGSGGFRSDTRRFTWPVWDQPTYRERLKQSYSEVTGLYGGIK